MTIAALGTAPGRWKYDTKPQSIGRDPTRFPHTKVIGEIKPHNTSGIRDGIKQLRRHYNRNRGRGFAYQLVTYRQERSDVTRYDVLVADPIQLGTIVRSRSGAGRVATWYRIGTVQAGVAARTIPLWQCPPTLGNFLEPKVRAYYQGWMRNTQGHRQLSLPRKSASTTGADFAHELADFLRELAEELEAEFGST